MLQAYPELSWIHDLSYNPPRRPTTLYQLAVDDYSSVYCPAPSLLHAWANKDLPAGIPPVAKEEALYLKRRRQLLCIARLAILARNGAVSCL